MTGTGTQADPFLVDSFGDFLSAVSTVGAFVKVAKDIDVSVDEEYKNGMNEPILIKCAHLYADEKATISGVHVQAANLITVSVSEDIVVENVDFLNCLHRSTGGVTVYSLSNANQATFRNCNFSIAKNGGSYGQAITLNNIFDHCSFFVELKNVESTETKPFHSTMIGCTIEIHGARLQHSTSASGSWILTNATRCSIVGDVVSADSTVRVFNNCGNCFAAIDFKSDTDLIEYGSDAVNFVVTDVSSANVTAQMTDLTSEQAKSKDHLLSIGFLP